MMDVHRDKNMVQDIPYEQHNIKSAIGCEGASFICIVIFAFFEDYIQQANHSRLILRKRSGRLSWKRPDAESDFCAKYVPE